MNDAVFLNNFTFNEFNYLKLHHTDNSRGVEQHFIGLVKQGKALIVSEDIRIELKEGDMFYIPKGCKYHSYWNTTHESVLLDSIGFFYFPSASLSGYILQKIDYDSELFRMFEPLSRDKTVNSKAIGQLYLLLDALEKIMVEAKGDCADRMVERLIYLMNEDHTLKISDYAAKCGVSEGLLYIYCKSKLKKTPNRLRQEIACQKATGLLCTTTLSVEAVCDRCGFSSTSYFRKVLFEITGKTPTEIRKEAKLI